MKKPILRLLFIKLKHFGDVLLLTPTLASVRQAYPEAHITVLVRAGTETILSAGLADEILTTVPPEKERRNRSAWREQFLLLSRLRKERFDYIFELTDGDRGRWLGALCRAGLRCTCTYAWVGKVFFWRYFFYKGLDDFNWLLCHRVEKDYRLTRRFLPLLPEKAPPLVLRPSTEGIIAQRPFVVIHPASRWGRKLWPLARWEEVGKYLVGNGFRCIISSGPDEEERRFAQDLRSLIGPDAEVTGGLQSWSELSALLSKAALFVGIDTAAMHVAAACQTPIVALFGPSIEHHWHPWHTKYEIVSPGGPLHHRFPEFFYEAPKRSMNDITVEKVILACDRMLESAKRNQ